MKAIYYLFPMFSVCFLSGCIMHNDKLEFKKFGHVDSGDKRIAFLDDSYSYTDFYEYLEKYHFQVKPFSSQKRVSITSNNKGGKYSETFNKAAAVYGITSSTYANYNYTCLVGDGIWVKTKVIVTDLSKDSIVMIIKGAGLSGDCQSFSDPPIWDSIAKKMSENWN